MFKKPTQKPAPNPVRDNIALATFSTCYMALRQIEIANSIPGKIFSFDDIYTSAAIDAYRLADAALYVRDHPELVTKLEKIPPAVVEAMSVKSTPTTTSEPGEQTPSA